MPRILCLHGYGTSSKIFESQLLNLRHSLPSDYELVFAEGEIECNRGAGIPQAVPGPFLCYFNNVTFDDVREAHELLQVIIEEEGPFDGVFAFSQGAGLALSYLLELERQDPGMRAPFKFAVLFSPVVALSPDCDFPADAIESITGQDFDFFAKAIDEATESKKDPASSTAQKQDQYFTKLAVSKYEDDSAIRHQVYVSSVGGILRAGIKGNFLSPSQMKEHIIQQDERAVARAFHPALLPYRVQIPTVHVTGSKDDADFQSQFKIMPFLCRKGSVRHVVHNGKHDLPRAPNDIKEVVKAIEWAIGQSQLLVF